MAEMINDLTDSDQTKGEGVHGHHHYKSAKKDYDGFLAANSIVFSVKTGEREERAKKLLKQFDLDHTEKRFDLL